MSSKKTSLPSCESPVQVGKGPAQVHLLVTAVLGLLAGTYLLSTPPGAEQVTGPRGKPASAPGAVPSTPTTAPASVTASTGRDLPPGAVSRTAVGAFRHPGHVNTLAFTPDGRQLLSSGKDYAIRVWDVRTGKQVHRRAIHEGTYQFVSLSPDGKLYAHNTKRAGIAFVEVESGKEVRRIPGEGGTVEGLAFSHDGRRLAFSTNRGIMQVVEVATGRELRRGTEENGLIGHLLSFSLDGKCLAVGKAGAIEVWDGGATRRLRTLRWPEPGAPDKVGQLLALAFSRDGKFLAALHLDGRVRLWDPTSGKILRELDSKRGYLSSLALSADSKLVVSTTGEEVLVWDSGTGKLLHRLPTGHARCLSISPDGRTLAVGDRFWIRLWDLASGKELRPRPPEHEEKIVALGFTPSTPTLLATRDLQARVGLWDATSGRNLALAEQRGWVAGVRTFQATVQEQPVSMTCDGRHLDFWQEASFRRFTRRFAPKQPIIWATLSPDGKLLAATCRGEGDGESSLLLWDVPAGRLRWSTDLPTVPSVPAHPPAVVSTRQLAISPDGNTVACVIQRNRIGLWDSRTGRPHGLLTAHETAIASLAFAPDGAVLASGSGGGTFQARLDDATIHLWDVSSGTKLLSMECSDGAVCCVVFSPEGHLLASASHFGAIHLWEIASGKEILSYESEGCWARCLAFDASGRRLASGMSDGTALVWDVLSPSKVVVTPSKVASLWQELSSAEARIAYRAVCALASAPPLVLPHFREQLCAVPVASTERIRNLVADLDHDTFSRRQEAARALSWLGPQAEPELRRALRDKKTSSEARSRITPLLEALSRWAVTDPEVLRAVRAVWVLERIGTKEARQLLQRLAEGAPAARQTLEARAALQRLQGRAPPQ